MFLTAKEERAKEKITTLIKDTKRELIAKWNKQLKHDLNQGRITEEQFKNYYYTIQKGGK